MKEKWKPYLMVLPVVLVLMGTLFSGLAMGLLQSLGRFSAMGLENWTLAYYIKAFSNQDFLHALGYSFYLSGLSATLSTLVGVGLAYSLKHLGSRGVGLSRFYHIPIAIPHIVAVMMVSNIFAQSGILSRLAYGLGWIDKLTDFPSLIYHPKGWGIILVYIWKEMPFVLMTTYMSLSKLNEQWHEVASNLGASAWQIFRYIEWPLLKPTIYSAFVMIFAFSFGGYEVPYLLGANYPKTLPIYGFLAYTSGDLKDRPYAMAINLLMAGICFLGLEIYFKYQEKNKDWQL